MTFDYQAAGRAAPALRVSAAPADLAAARMRFLPRHEIEACKTFRDACVLAWKNRAEPAMTETYLAIVADLTQQHVSDYFHPADRAEKNRKRRKLPADKIGVVQKHLGNCAIAQWLARDMAVRLVEEFFAAESGR